MTQVLAIALVLSLALLGSLLSRPDVQRVIFPSAEAKGQVVSTPASNNQPVVVNTQISAVGVPVNATNLDALLVQLQTMQTLLQATSNQLEQKSQASGLLLLATPTVRPALVEDDLPALWAEIEQLNQIMQPLMIQLETANANRSSRSANELAAMRTQVNTIHQRLADLLARVEAAKARANGTVSGAYPAQNGMSTGLPTNSTNPNLAAYQQLYQTMTELQRLLQQMQNQATLR
jgi:hypothetical protein